MSIFEDQIRHEILAFRDSMLKTRGGFLALGFAQTAFAGLVQAGLMRGAIKLDGCANFPRLQNKKAVASEIGRQVAERLFAGQLDLRDAGSFVTTTLPKSGFPGFRFASTEDFTLSLDKKLVTEAVGKINPSKPRDWPPRVARAKPGDPWWKRILFS